MRFSAREYSNEGYSRSDLSAAFGRFQPNPAIRIKIHMNTTGVAFRPDQTGCHHKYSKKSLFKIYGIPAAKCSTCGRVIAWTNPGTPTELTWIAEASKFAAELASYSELDSDPLVDVAPFSSSHEQSACI
jgi:hypothetical protein